MRRSEDAKWDSFSINVNFTLVGVIIRGRVVTICKVISILFKWKLLGQFIWQSPLTTDTMH